MHKEEASKLFKALGDPTRVKIIKMLFNNDEICVCKLKEKLDCAQSTLSFHLSSLEKAGLIQGKKDGRWIKYSCNKVLIAELMSFFSTPCKCVEMN